MYVDFVMVGVYVIGCFVDFVRDRWRCVYYWLILVVYIFFCGVVVKIYFFVELDVKM